MNLSANTTDKATTSLPPEVLAWCGKYGDFALDLAKWFLILALLVALVETALLLWGKIKTLLTKPEDMEKKGLTDTVDPVKLIDALKGLLETLKGLPAWVAIFLAGLALLWMAGQTPKVCEARLGTAIQTGSRTGDAPAPPQQPGNAQAPAPRTAR